VTTENSATFEVKIQVELFRVVTPCNVGAFTLKMEAAWTSEALISCHNPAKLDKNRQF
jgi:hypothetical protein